MTQNTSAIYRARLVAFSLFCTKKALRSVALTPDGGVGGTAIATANATTADAPAPSETVGSHQAPLPMTAGTTPHHTTDGRTDGTQRVQVLSQIKGISQTLRTVCCGSPLVAHFVRVHRTWEA